MTTIVELFNEAKNLRYSDMCRVETMKKVGFFPGAYGTHNGEDLLLDKKIMVLGQDFDTQSYYENLPDDGENIETNATWRNLRNLLSDSEIDEKLCFFTNAFMGLRKAGTKNTGISPAWADVKFVEACQELFLKQLLATEFGLVLVMGKEVARFLSGVKGFEDSFSKWRRINKVGDLYDIVNGNSKIEIQIDNRTVVFQFITHPCLNKSNLARRWGKDGYSREVNYVKDAWQIAKTNCVFTPSGDRPPR